MVGGDMTDGADLFLKYDYAETKDLLKTFITLVSATLVFSLTFSEKVVNFSSAPLRTRQTLFASWALLIGALIAAGIGLAFIAAAAGVAIYGAIPLLSFDGATLALISWSFVLVAGFVYVAGLIMMAVAAKVAIGSAVVTTNSTLTGTAEADAK